MSILIIILKHEYVFCLSYIIIIVKACELRKNSSDYVKVMDIEELYSYIFIYLSICLYLSQYLNMRMYFAYHILSLSRFESYKKVL
jgi:hypothetical protein